MLYQVENERNIELSFRNSVLRKASLFRKKYRRIFGYAFSEKSNLFSRNLEKRFRPFARPGRLWFMATFGRKGRFLRSCPPGRMPLKELLMLCAGQSRKSAPKGDVSRKRKTNFGWDCMSRGASVQWKKKRACCHFDSNNRSFFWVNRIRRKQSPRHQKTLFFRPDLDDTAIFLVNYGMETGFGLSKSRAIAPSEKGPTELFFGKIGKTRRFFRKMVNIYGRDNRDAAGLPFPHTLWKKREKWFRTWNSGEFFLK